MKKSADAVLCQCCNFCFLFSPYVVRSNCLYYWKYFWSLFLCHILDFDLNCSVFFLLKGLGQTTGAAQGMQRVLQCVQWCECTERTSASELSNMPIRM